MAADQVTLRSPSTNKLPQRQLLPLPLTPLPLPRHYATTATAATAAWHSTDTHDDRRRSGDTAITVDTHTITRVANDTQDGRR